MAEWINALTPWAMGILTILYVLSVALVKSWFLRIDNDIRIQGERIDRDIQAESARLDREIDIHNEKINKTDIRLQALENNFTNLDRQIIKISGQVDAILEKIEETPRLFAKMVHKIIKRDD